MMANGKLIGKTLVELADTLVDDYDPIELLHLLTARCAELLDVSDAGVCLADDQGRLNVLASSSERMRLIELIEVQREDGPCLDCYRGRAAVAVADLEEALHRWPQFVPAARAAGFASVHALPMRLRDNVLGALGLFGTAVGSLNDEDLALGQALADVASVALVQDKAAADKAAVNEQLQTALTSRVVLEQAKGILSQLGGLDMPQAFTVLRSYARDHNLRLTDVAQAVAARSLPAHQLIEYAQARVPKQATSPASPGGARAGLALAARLPRSRRADQSG